MRTGKFENVGLFLAVLAAFALGFGAPQVASAAPEMTEVEELTAEQEALVEAAVETSPHARLAVRMVQLGYEESEIIERLELLTDDEIASLADEPIKMEAGAKAPSR